MIRDFCSEEEGEGIYAYRGESRFSDVDVESIQEIAFSRPEHRDRSTVTLRHSLQ